MRFFAFPFLKARVLVGVLLALASGLYAKPEAKPNLQALITEISKASKSASGKADAVDLVDQIAKWEQLIKVSAHLSALITAQIESSETMLEDFRKKALANPSKARLYDSLANNSTQQIGQLRQVKGAIASAVERLRKEVARVRGNPEAAEILELRAKQRLIRQKVHRLNSVVSPEIEQVLEETE